MDNLSQKLSLACWIAKTFFDRNLGAGTSGNLSFSHDEKIYITASNTCFGRLTADDFSVIDRSGNILNKKKPSKEWPLHLAIYASRPSVGSVIHIHSTYSVLWSCIQQSNETDCVPSYTPYLKMKLGTVGLIPYAKPGSLELLEHLQKALPLSDGWIMKNHGLLTPGKDLMSAFSAAEELEAACRIAWELKDFSVNEIQ